MFGPLLNTLIFFTLTTPLIGLIGQRIEHERSIVAAYAIIAFILSLALIPVYYSEILLTTNSLVIYGSASPEGIFLEVNLFSLFMAIIFLFIGVMVSLFSIQEINRNRITAYFTILLGMITAMIVIVFSGDLFTLFISWECMCICSYTLVAFKKNLWQSIESSYKYFIMSSTGNVIMLFALSYLYGLTGSLNMSYLSVSLLEAGGNPLTYIILFMLIVGFGLQAGMVPFHTWLPDAHMAATSSISAILSGIVVIAGIYGLFKVLFVVFAFMNGSWYIILATFAVLTMFVGNISALFQDDIKRLLAYSTIANVGYILLGFAIGSFSAIVGSLFHVLNHAIIKALLFLCAGAFVYRAKTRSLKELAGIRHTMPITSSMFMIGVLALASIPFLNIFWSELAIILSGLEGGNPLLSLLMVVNMIFAAAYCLRMLQIVAIEKISSTSKKSSEAPISMLLPILILGFLAIIIGIYPSPFQTIIERVVQSVLNLI